MVLAHTWEDLILRPAKEERSLTQSGDTRPRWNAVSTKVRKQSPFGWILHSCPFPVLRVAVSAYKMQRVLVLHGGAVPTGHPSRGVVAGCAIATYLVKLYCLPVLDNVVRLHPRVTLDVFIDDSHQSAQGTPREARKLIVAAGRTFTEEAQSTSLACTQLPCMGTDVSGISDVEWRSMQRLASAAHSPLTAGRSLSALWLWYEDPTASSIMAPILRWSKEVWLAATHPRGETGEHGQFLKVLNLPALRRIWERGRSQRPERWQSVKGPVCATSLSLVRCLWWDMGIQLDLWQDRLGFSECFAS